MRPTRRLPAGPVSVRRASCSTVEHRHRSYWDRHGGAVPCRHFPWRAVVAREIERGTAALAWSLSPSGHLAHRAACRLDRSRRALAVLIGRAGSQTALLVLPQSEDRFLATSRCDGLAARDRWTGGLRHRPGDRGRCWALPSARPSLAARAPICRVELGLRPRPLTGDACRGGLGRPSASAGWPRRPSGRLIRFRRRRRATGFDEAFDRIPSFSPRSGGDQIPPVHGDGLPGQPVLRVTPASSWVKACWCSSEPSAGSCSQQARSLALVRRSTGLGHEAGGRGQGRRRGALWSEPIRQARLAFASARGAVGVDPALRGVLDRVDLLVKRPPVAESAVSPTVSMPFAPMSPAWSTKLPPVLLASSKASPALSWASPAWIADRIAGSVERSARAATGIPGRVADGIPRRARCHRPRRRRHAPCRGRLGRVIAFAGDLVLHVVEGVLRLVEEAHAQPRFVVGAASPRSEHDAGTHGIHDVSCPRSGTESTLQMAWNYL